MPHEIRHNTGLIFENQPNPTDYIRGIASGILLIERLSDGDWSKYRSKGEKQHSVYFDSMACVSFSFNNNIEQQINWLKQTGKLTDDFLLTLLTPEELVLFKEFFNDLGEADLSDRALAKLSGTSRQGNTLSWVAITGRNFAVPERAYGYPRDQRIPVFDWDDFYAPIDEDLVRRYSKVFFKVFNIKSEWIPNNASEIAIHLKHAPIQIASGVCEGWGTDDPIQACGRHNEHATVTDRSEPQIKTHLFDTYVPFGKSIAWDYSIDGALKLIVEINKPKLNTMVVKENYLYQLVEGTGGFALGLNGNLIIDDVAKILASWLVRTKGNTTGRTEAVTLADWNSVKHYNLKMQPVP